MNFAREEEPSAAAAGSVAPAAFFFFLCVLRLFRPRIRVRSTARDLFSSALWIGFGPGYELERLERLERRSNEEHRGAFDRGGKNLASKRRRQFFFAFLLLSSSSSWSSLLDPHAALACLASAAASQPPILALAQRYSSRHCICWLDEGNARLRAAGAGVGRSFRKMLFALFR